MKYIAARHNPTAFDLSKKARPPPGRITATRLYYTTQIKQTIQYKPPGGSVTCRAVCIVSCDSKIFIHFFLCGKRFCAQNLYLRTLC